MISLSPRERTLATIRHNRNKLLFEKGICISGDKLIDKIFKAPSDTKFDFSEVKIKKRKKFKKK